MLRVDSVINDMKTKLRVEHVDFERSIKTRGPISLRETIDTLLKRYQTIRKLSLPRDTYAAVKESLLNQYGNPAKKKKKIAFNENTRQLILAGVLSQSSMVSEDMDYGEENTSDEENKVDEQDEDNLLDVDDDLLENEDEELEDGEEKLEASTDYDQMGNPDDMERMEADEDEDSLEEPKEVDYDPHKIRDLYKEFMDSEDEVVDIEEPSPVKKAGMDEDDQVDGFETLGEEDDEDVSDLSVEMPSDEDSLEEPKEEMETDLEPNQLVTVNGREGVLLSVNEEEGTGTVSFTSDYKKQEEEEDSNEYSSNSDEDEEPLKKDIQEVSLNDISLAKQGGDDEVQEEADDADSLEDTGSDSEEDQEEVNEDEENFLDVEDALLEDGYDNADNTSDEESKVTESEDEDAGEVNSASQEDKVSDDEEQENLTDLDNDLTEQDDSLIGGQEDNTSDEESKVNEGAHDSQIPQILSIRKQLKSLGIEIKNREAVRTPANQKTLVTLRAKAKKLRDDLSKFPVTARNAASQASAKKSENSMKKMKESFNKVQNKYRLLSELRKKKMISKKFFEAKSKAVLEYIKEYKSEMKKLKVEFTKPEDGQLLAIGQRVLYAGTFPGIVTGVKNDKLVVKLDTGGVIEDGFSQFDCMDPSNYSKGKANIATIAKESLVSYKGLSGKVKRIKEGKAFIQLKEGGILRVPVSKLKLEDVGDFEAGVDQDEKDKETDKLEAQYNKLKALKESKKITKEQFVKFSKSLLEKIKALKENDGPDDEDDPNPGSKPYADKDIENALEELDDQHDDKNAAPDTRGPSQKTADNTEELVDIVNGDDTILDEKTIESKMKKMRESYKKLKSQLESKLKLKENMDLSEPVLGQIKNIVGQYQDSKSLGELVSIVKDMFNHNFSIDISDDAAKKLISKCLVSCSEEVPQQPIQANEEFDQKVGTGEKPKGDVKDEPVTEDEDMDGTSVGDQIDRMRESEDITDADVEEIEGIDNETIPTDPKIDAIKKDDLDQEFPNPGTYEAIEDNAENTSDEKEKVSEAADEDENEEDIKKQNDLTDISISESKAFLKGVFSTLKVVPRATLEACIGRYSKKLKTASCLNSWTKLGLVEKRGMSFKAGKKLV